MLSILSFPSDRFRRQDAGTVSSTPWFPSRVLAAVLLSLLVGGCARYHPLPITPEQGLEDFEARRLDAPELGSFLSERGEATTWPPTVWDFETLTRAAFYYSPALDVARAQWAVAQGGVVTAGARPNPTVSGALGYNSTTPRDEITPWIPEGALDLPLEIAGKRGLRIAEARQLSEAARLNLLTAAWQVRGRVRNASLLLYVARQTDSLLARQREIQTESVRILESQREVGEVSPAEVTRARVDLANLQAKAADAAQTAVRARAELADALGVPPAALDAVRLSFGEWSRVEAPVPELEARRQAMIHRSDVLASLAEYEASQKALQLEVRQQYPDISLGPGYQLDQTDSKWTLALAVTLPLLNHNQGPIAEAMARREEAGASFLALQSRVLSEVEGAVAAAQVAATQVQASDTLLAALERQEGMARAAYSAGEISRLELLGLQAEAVATGLARLDALALAQAAVGALEDAMQTPMDMEMWALAAPERNSRSREEER
jgi:cobalt-zinc-cadmium efflux system outer membrane protein